MADKDKNANAFQRLVTISSLTKLADLFVSPKTTLPWILTAGGAPGWIISLLVPIKESGSLLPQWLLKNTLNGYFSNHTAFWRVGALVQGVGILIMVAVMLQYEGNILAVLVLTLLMLIAFGRAICSLSMKSIQAQSVEKGHRGRLIGLASSISGGLTLVSALVFITTSNPLSKSITYGLLISGGVMFLLATLVSLPMQIKNNDSDKGQAHAGSMFSLLKAEKDLRQLIISRVLLMHSALIVPFVVAASSASVEGSGLSYFVALSALASLLSSYVWGAIADKSALLTLRIAACVCVLTSFLVGIGVADYGNYVDLILFFVLTLGHAGIRTGRKTYLLDITETGNRSGYVAAANTMVGIALLVMGGLYALLSHFISNNVILLMSGMLLVGLIHSLFLNPEK